MLKNLSLTMKMAMGFGIILILMAILAGVSYNAMNKVEDRESKLNNVNQLVQRILEMRREEKNYILRGNKQYLDNHQKLYAEMISTSKKLKEDFKDQYNKDEMDKIIKFTNEYKTAVVTYIKLQNEKNNLENSMLKDIANLEKEATEVREDQKKLYRELVQSGANAGLLNDRVMKADSANRIIKIMLDMKVERRNYVITKDEKSAKSVQNLSNNIKNEAENLLKTLKREQNIKQINDVTNALDTYLKNFNKYVDLTKTQIKAENTMLKDAKEVREQCYRTQADQKKKLEAVITSTNLIIISGALIAIILGIAMSYFITRSITKPLNTAINSLTESSEQVASGSQQVSVASQKLAEGASESAASLEETSASLEEIAAMSQSNSTSSEKADEIAQNTTQIVNRANESMVTLKIAIEDINKTSEQTVKIIKVIDDIAFQTNLLSLNAAVEAARAGEAGMGFAVVADEVRNLAQRTSEAAKSTAELIENSIKNIKEGFTLTQNTEKEFIQVVESMVKLKELIGEVTSSSQEQSKAIEQVSITVATMNQVTQNNASSSEESASASEELGAQAQSMITIVDSLNQIIGRNGNGLLNKISGNGHNGNGHHKIQIHPIEHTSMKPLEYHPIGKKDYPTKEFPMDHDFKDFK